MPFTGGQGGLPNTQKQTQGGCQIEETKKYGSNERREQNSRKRTKQNRGKNEGYEKLNIQETNSEGKETRTQINGLEQKEEINIQPEQKE